MHAIQIRTLFAMLAASTDNATRTGRVRAGNGNTVCAAAGNANRVPGGNSNNDSPFRCC